MIRRWPAAPRPRSAELPLPRPDREHLTIGPILRVVETVHDARSLLVDLLGADHEETVAVAVPIAWEHGHALLHQDPVHRVGGFERAESRRQHALGLLILRGHRLAALHHLVE